MSAGERMARQYSIREYTITGPCIRTIGEEIGGGPGVSGLGLVGKVLGGE